MFRNGVNLQPSYAKVNLQPNGGVSFGWDLMKQCQNIKTVRIEIEPDRETEQHPLKWATSWLQQACVRYDVIATYHRSDLLGSNNVDDLMTAAYWWKYNYDSLRTTPVIHEVTKADILKGDIPRAIAQQYLGDAKRYREIIQANEWILASQHKISPGDYLKIPFENRPFRINLMNEWGDHNLTAKQYAEAYNRAIKIVRDVYNDRLIIDVPGWAQETAVAASAVMGDGTDGGTDGGTHGLRINDRNIMLSVHIYRDAYVHQKAASSKDRSGWLTNADLLDLHSTGMPCMIGEFGSGHTGNADWATLVDYAKTLQWPVLGWAWNGHGKKKDAFMNMVTPTWETDANPPSLHRSSYFDTICSKL